MPFTMLCVGCKGRAEICFYGVWFCVACFEDRDLVEVEVGIRPKRHPQAVAYAEAFLARYE